MSVASKTTDEAKEKLIPFDSVDVEAEPKRDLFIAFRLFHRFLKRKKMTFMLHAFLMLLTSPFVLLTTILLYGRHLYLTLWLPWLERVNDHTGGRANAGRVAKHARELRIVVNVIALTAILASVLISGGFTAFWASGALLSVWAAGITMACMLVNMTAVHIGTAANYRKIQQYTHEELTLHEWINEKKDEADRQPLPFSMRKRIMLFFRYLHDFNGLAGSFVSLFIFISCAINFIAPGTVGYPLVVAAACFVASRLSSLLSVAFAPITNQMRIAYYKKRLNEQVHEYLAANKLKHAKQAGCIERLINPLVQDAVDKHISEKNHELLRFACYRACEQAFGLETISEAQIAEAKKTIQNEIASHFADRAACKHRRYGMKVSYIEDLNLLSNRIAEKLRHPKEVTRQSNRDRIPFKEEYPHSLMAQVIYANVNEGEVDTVKSNMTTSPYLILKKGVFEMDVTKIKKEILLPGNQHGDELVDKYHTNEIWNRINVKSKVVVVNP